MGFDIHQVRRNRDFVAANIRAEEEDETMKMGSGMSSLLQTFSVTSPPTTAVAHVDSHISNSSGQNGRLLLDDEIIIEAESESVEENNHHGNEHNLQEKPANIRDIRKKLRAAVEAVKGKDFVKI